MKRNSLVPFATSFVAAVCAAGLMSALCSEIAGAGANEPIRWLFSGPAVAALAADTAASRLLDHTRPFVMWGRHIPGVPASWNAVPLMAFRSLAAIRDAFESGGIGPEVKGVMYDYERWRFTPGEEQRNAAPYVKQAADLVHARGLLFLTAPAVNLVTVMAPAEDTGRMYDAYLRLGIAADAARYADAFDIQAQRFEGDTGLYRSFVTRAAAQARQANPAVIVLAGISTQPIGHRVTAGEIVQAIAATRDVVDGYWFNIPQPSAYSPRATEFRPDIAIDVLRRLAGQRQAAGRSPSHYGRFAS